MLSNTFIPLGANFIMDTFNPSMDKQLYQLSKVEWNYISIPNDCTV